MDFKLKSGFESHEWERGTRDLNCVQEPPMDNLLLTETSMVSYNHNNFPREHYDHF